MAKSAQHNKHIALTRTFSNADRGCTADGEECSVFVVLHHFLGALAMKLFSKQGLEPLKFRETTGVV